MYRSSAFPWTYVESFLAGRRARATFQDVQSYVMFIGQPRSGTSLIGSLLNAHRHTLFCQELNALKYILRGYNRDQLYWLIHKRDEEFADGGRRWTGYDYEVPNQWQGRYEKLLVIGDKKAGCSSEIIRRHPHVVKMLEHRVGVPVRMVHVVRNPFDTITTISRKRNRTSLRKAARMYLERCETNWRLLEDRGEAIATIHLEDVIANPRQHLVDLARFIGVQPDEEYIDACAGLLFSEPRQTKASVDWPDDLIDMVIQRIDKYPFLRGYDFANPLPGEAAKAA